MALSSSAFASALAHALLGLCIGVQVFLLSVRAWEGRHVASSVNLSVVKNFAREHVRMFVVDMSTCLFFVWLFPYLFI